MPTLYYRIYENKKNKDGKVAVHAIISVDGRNKWKTVTWIKADQWEPKPEKDKWLKTGATGSKDYVENKKTNQLLRDYKNRVTDYLNQCTVSGTKIDFKLVCDYLDMNDPTPEKQNFWIIYDLFLKSGQTQKGIKEDSTMRVAKNTMTRLKAFEKTTGFKMSFDAINMNFDERFQRWILKDQQRGWNYYCSHIRRLKTFLNWAVRMGYNSNIQFKAIKAKEIPGTIIYLTEAELQSLYNFNFENPKYARVRDIFCFECFTGLRYSDIELLRREHIHDDFLIKYPKKVKKENESLVIPLAEPAKAIIERYQYLYRPLPKLSNQKLNKSIKEAAGEAGITTVIEYKDFSGGKTEILKAAKNKLISSHTGRKTFICMAFAKGMDTQTIMKITGIRDVKTLMRYLDITKETTKEAVDHVFRNF